MRPTRKWQAGRATDPDRGHSLTVDPGRSEVAQAALDWLAKQGIRGQAPPA